MELTAYPEMSFGKENKYKGRRRGGRGGGKERKDRVGMKGGRGKAVQVIDQSEEEPKIQLT